MAHGNPPFLILPQKIKFERMQFFNISRSQNIIENNMSLIHFLQ